MENKLEEFNEALRDSLKDLTEEEATWFLEILHAKLKSIGELWRQK